LYVCAKRVRRFSAHTVASPDTVGGLLSDVSKFDRRAESYDEGPLGDWHRLVAARTASAALQAAPGAGRILDVGCGTGALLREVASRAPATAELVGIDPAPRMLAGARSLSAHDGRISFREAVAEHLPFDAGSFDLVVAVLSFDHWSDQRAGLVECARIVRGGGCLVVSDLFASWLWVTTFAGRPRRVRTPRRATNLIHIAGFHTVRWQPIFNLGPLPLIRTATAER
jgi:ubiquinone/menaquinone biosynthesis C-methylase UbiE